MSNNIRSYWEGHTVDSAKKERERLKKKYNPKGAPRKAQNADDNDTVPIVKVTDAEIEREAREKDMTPAEYREHYSF